MSFVNTSLLCVLQALSIFTIVSRRGCLYLGAGYVRIIEAKYDVSDKRVWFLLRAYRKSSMLSRMVTWPYDVMVVTQCNTRITSPIDLLTTVLIAYKTQSMLACCWHRQCCKLIGVHIVNESLISGSHLLQINDFAPPLNWITAQVYIYM